MTKDRCKLPESPPPLVCELNISDLSDEEFREVWGSKKLRWAIAYQVRYIRLKRGWSQEELARRSGKCPTQISRIENASGTWPAVSSLKALAKAFDCGLIIRFCMYSEFLRFIGELESGEYVASPGFDNEKADE